MFSIRVLSGHLEYPSSTAVHSREIVYTCTVQCAAVTCVRTEPEPLVRTMWDLFRTMGDLVRTMGDLFRTMWDLVITMWDLVRTMWDLVRTMWDLVRTRHL